MKPSKSGSSTNARAASTELRTPVREAAPPDERITWDDLRYIEALDRLGSTRRASRELRASVSTVYRRIALLEAMVGARCVETGEGGRLTETGAALAAIARQVEISLAEVAQRVRSAEKDVSGEVSLTTTEGFVPILAPHLVRLAERHPRLRVALVVADQGPSVRRREVDVAISLVATPPQSLHGRRLFTVRYGVFGTAAATSARPLRWVARGPAFSHPAQVEWEKQHVPSSAFRTTSVAATLALVRAGAGVAVLPRRLAEIEPALVEISSYRPSMAALDRVAWVLTHPDIQSTRAVRALMDMLVSVLAAGPADADG